eukprot:15472570-Alexandrium_andersonii.AAC.1
MSTNSPSENSRALGAMAGLKPWTASNSAPKTGRWSKRSHICPAGMMHDMWPDFGGVRPSDCPKFTKRRPSTAHSREARGMRSSSKRRTSRARWDNFSVNSFSTSTFESAGHRKPCR